MPSNFARITCLTIILAAGLLTAPASYASSITGDTFTVSVSEDLVSLAGSASGVAGSSGIDVALTPDNASNPNTGFDVDWIDGDTFEIDWFSGENTDLKNLKITLTDLDFFDGAIALDIVGVTPLPIPPNGFDWDKEVTFTENSITIVYPLLDVFQAADGSSPLFDVLTAERSPVPSITGDNFTVTVSEEFGTVAGSESGTAGSTGIDVGVYPSNSVFEVDWIDADTFNLNFYASEGKDLENLTITLSDLDFRNGGIPVNIIGVTPLPIPPNGFDWVKQVSFTKNSITIIYPYLDIFQAADGSWPSFDVVTALPGDFNLDGDVDADDLRIFSRYYGSAKVK